MHQTMYIYDTWKAKVALNSISQARHTDFFRWITFRFTIAAVTNVWNNIRFYSNLVQKQNIFIVLSDKQFDSCFAQFEKLKVSLPTISLNGNWICLWGKITSMTLLKLFLSTVIFCTVFHSVLSSGNGFLVLIHTSKHVKGA